VRSLLWDICCCCRHEQEPRAVAAGQEGPCPRVGLSPLTGLRRSGKAFPPLTTQRKTCTGGGDQTTVLPNRFLPKKKLKNGVWWQGKRYGVKERPVKGVSTHAVSCDAAVPLDATPFLRVHLLGLCGQRGAEGRRSGGLAVCRPRFHNSSSHAHSNSLYDQYVFVSKHQFASAFSQSNTGSG